MDIEELTLKQIRKISSLIANLENKKYPIEIGKAYFFRTVTQIEIGRVVSICGNFVTLEEASWIADTGRYYNCLKEGIEQEDTSEIEPYPETTTLNMESLINFAPWSHDLPKIQKRRI